MPHSSAWFLATSCQLLVKTVSSNFDLKSPLDPTNEGVDKNWKFFLRSLSDLSANRTFAMEQTDSSLTVELQNHRPSYFFNPKTQTVITDPNRIQQIISEMNPREYIPGQTRFTVSTATTLLPRDGNIHLYGVSSEIQYAVGLGFCLRHVHLNNEYTVFEQDAFTDLIWWRMKDFAGKAKPAATINQVIVRQRLDQKCETTRDHNEFWVGVNSDSVCCIILQMGESEKFKQTIQDEYFTARLDAIYRKQQMFSLFNRHLPILIIDKERGIIEYTVEQQDHDLRLLLSRCPANTVAQNLLKMNHSMPAVEMEYSLERRIDCAIMNLHYKIKHLYTIYFQIMEQVFFLEQEGCNEGEVRKKIKELGTLLVQQQNLIRDQKEYILTQKLDRPQENAFASILKEESDSEESYFAYQGDWHYLMLCFKHGYKSPTMINAARKIFAAKPNDPILLENVAYCVCCYVNVELLNSNALANDEFTIMLKELLNKTDSVPDSSDYCRQLLIFISEKIKQHAEKSNAPTFFGPSTSASKQFYSTLYQEVFSKLDLMHIQSHESSAERSSAAAAAAAASAASTATASPKYDTFTYTP